MSNIHPSAIIEPGAKIGKNVTIEAYAIIKGTVTLHDNVVIKSHAYIDGNTTIGEGTVIWPSASIGTKTQDLKFRGEKTFVIIGKNCEIREFATINSSCQENSVVKIGDHCLIMAYCHVAHNCEIGNRVIMANNAMLAGHVVVEDYAIIGGMTPVHQFSRIGCYSMVGGFSRITHDVPPYTLGAGAPYRLGGLNLIGLKRHGFNIDVRRALTKAFKLTYRSGLRLAAALEIIEDEVDMNPHVTHWVNFCKASKRGLIGLHGISNDSQEDFSAYEELLEEEPVLGS
jgi:UDP-N-acetylglucosamine acyltransferase